MCCQRCIEAVQEELVSLGLKVEEIKLGEATFVEKKSLKINVLSEALHDRGFELILSEDIRLVEAVKTTLIELIHQSKKYQDDKIHLTEFIEEKLKKPYRAEHQWTCKVGLLCFCCFVCFDQHEVWQALQHKSPFSAFFQLLHL